MVMLMPSSIILPLLAETNKNKVGRRSVVAELHRGHNDNRCARAVREDHLKISYRPCRTFPCWTHPPALMGRQAVYGTRTRTPQQVSSSRLPGEGFPKRPASEMVGGIRVPAADKTAAGGLSLTPGQLWRGN